MSAELLQAAKAVVEAWDNNPHDAWDYFSMQRLDEAVQKEERERARVKQQIEKFWNRCPTCRGEGLLELKPFYIIWKKIVVCPQCNGTGRLDIFATMDC